MAYNAYINAREKRNKSALVEVGTKNDIFGSA